MSNFMPKHVILWNINFPNWLKKKFFKTYMNTSIITVAYSATTISSPKMPYLDGFSGKC